MGGGDHGHNGLRSITKALGTKDYVRIALGIGRPPGRMDVASYVLKPFSKAENAWLPIAVADAADATRLACSRGRSGHALCRISRVTTELLSAWEAWLSR